MTVLDARAPTAIAAELRRSLQSQGITLMEDAPMVLLLHGETFGKRVLSVDDQGRAQEYGLSYELRFSLRQVDGELWLSRESVTANRELRFDATAVLATGREEARLRSEMIGDAVNNILRRLQNARPPTDLLSTQ